MSNQVSKRFLIILLGLLITLLFTANSFAVPALLANREFSQPTGEKFKASIHGDEWFNWIVSDSGDIVVKDKNGFWNYGKLSSGKLVSGGKVYKRDVRPSDALTDNDLKSAIKSKIINIPVPPRVEHRGRNRLNYSELSSISLPSSSLSTTDTTMTSTSQTSNISALQSSPQLTTLTGSDKMLILLVEFNDTSITNSDSAWYNEFFGTSKPSVNSYYKEVSGGKFSFSSAEESYGTTNDGIIKVKLSYNHPNTGSNVDSRNQQIVSDCKR